MELYPEAEHIILKCGCGERLVILGFEADWRLRRAVFKCECGQKLTLDAPADEKTFAAS